VNNSDKLIVRIERYGRSKKLTSGGAGEKLKNRKGNFGGMEVVRFSGPDFRGKVLGPALV